MEVVSSFRLFDAGFKSLEGMAEALDGTHVGVGRCLCLEEEGGGIMETQCCWTSPGRRRIIITGDTTIVTKESIHLMRELVGKQLSQIAEVLNVTVESLKLVRLHADLHFHCCKEDGQAVRPSYQMASIYVALISVLLGRRPRGNTVLFGDLNNTGYLSSVWPWGIGEIKACKARGIHRAILGERGYRY